MIGNVLNIMRGLQERTGSNYKRLCDVCDIKYSSFKRWLERENNNMPVVSSPGPRKVKPLNAQALYEDVKNLNHGRKRTAKTGELYDRYREEISKRQFQQLLSMAKYDERVEHEKNMRRIDWLTSGIVWAMDDTELGRDHTGVKIYEHLIQDLGARYKFPPLTGPMADHNRVAENLRKLFREFGAPVFLKMDGGSNLNGSSVYEVLNEFFVIPLVSPPYYSPYNGSIEKGNHELKAGLAEKLGNFPPQFCEELQLYSEVVVHDLNHKPRKCLNGENACRRFFNNKDKFKFNKRERRTAYDWINSRAGTILINMKDKSKTALKSAMRIAIESWLRLKGFIFVSINGKVLPYFGG